MSTFERKIVELAGLLNPTDESPVPASFYARHGVRGFIKESGQQNFQVAATAYALKIAAFQDLLGIQLEKHHIPFLSLKGLSLSKVLYGSIAKREFGDLDILVPPERAKDAIRVLEEFGLIRTYPAKLKGGQERALFRFGKAQNFCCPCRGLALDLHWRLLSPWVGYRLFEFRELWDESRVLREHGLPAWRTLGDTHTLIFLALHGYQDGWSSLKQIVDLASAVVTLRIDWDKVSQCAGPRASLVERAVELVVRLMEVPHPGRMTHHFASRDEALNEWLRLALNDKSPQSKLLHPAYWSCPRREMLLRSVRAFLNPALDDILSVKLPESLISVYIGVRMARLLWKSLKKLASLIPATR